jgi:hypothetical protein
VSQQSWDATQRDLVARIAAATVDRAKFDRDLDRWYEFVDEAREPQERSDDEGE